MGASTKVDLERLVAKKNEKRNQEYFFQFLHQL